MNTPINYKLINARKQIIIQQSGVDQLAYLLPEDDALLLRNRLRDLVQLDSSGLTLKEKGILLQSILDACFGFGPLVSLLRDPSTRIIRIFPDLSIQKDDDYSAVESFSNKEEFMKYLARIMHPRELSTADRKFECKLANRGSIKVDLDSTHPGEPILDLYLHS